jgi:hypothetical protein
MHDFFRKQFEMLVYDIKRMSCEGAICAALSNDTYVIPSGCCSIPLGMRGVYSIYVEGVNDLVGTAVCDGKIVCEGGADNNGASIDRCMIDSDYTLNICQVGSSNTTARVYFEAISSYPILYIVIASAVIFLCLTTIIFRRKLRKLLCRRAAYERVSGEQRAGAGYSFFMGIHLKCG